MKPRALFVLALRSVSVCFCGPLHLQRLVTKSMSVSAKRPFRLKMCEKRDVKSRHRPGHREAAPAQRCARRAARGHARGIPIRPYGGVHRTGPFTVRVCGGYKLRAAGARGRLVPRQNPATTPYPEYRTALPAVWMRGGLKRYRYTKLCVCVFQVR